MDVMESNGCGAAPAPSEQRVNPWSRVWGSGCGITVGSRTRRWGAAIPALGSDREQECGSPTAVTFCSASGTGRCHSPAGMCPLPLSGHPGTGYHWILASQGIPLQQVTASQRGGADGTCCCSAPAAGWEQSQARRPGGTDVQEPPPFLLEKPDPTLCSNFPSWAGCDVQSIASDAVNESEGL